MKEILKIGGSFLISLAIIIFVVWRLPDSFPMASWLKGPKIIPVQDSSSKLAIVSQYLKIKDTPVTNPDICLVGDSTATLAPWPFARITLAGKNCADLPTKIRETDFEIAPKTFVLMIGTWYVHRHREDEIPALEAEIRSAIQSRYPDANIIKVPEDVYLSIAKEHSLDDGWHLDDVGYRLLWEKQLEPAL